MDQTAPARLGILMLDSRFPRIPGDVGNPATWPFPVRYSVIPGATPDAIVCEDPAPFLQAFIAAGRTLVAEGCTGIATTCGFLSRVRPQLSQALGVPVASSALEQSAQVQASLPTEAVVGILTISKSALTPQHLSIAGVPRSAVVSGVEHSAFAASILGNSESLDVALARQELVAAAKSMKSDTPALGAIVLECTNMVPYAADIAAATSLPVYSIYSYLMWFHHSLAPPQFPAP